MATYEVKVKVLTTVRKFIIENAENSDDAIKKAKAQDIDLSNLDQPVFTATLVQQQ